MIKYGLLWLFLSLSSFGQKMIVEGKIVRVTDGDTVTILQDKQQYKIRLAGIDAPERKQDFGNRARKELAGLVAGKTVKAYITGQDRYKRFIGVIVVKVKNEDETVDLNVNLWLVKNGWAWNYLKYNQSKVYRLAELHAKKKKLGLWKDENAVSPWLFRKLAKEKRKLKNDN